LRPARAAKAFRYAVREEEFPNVFGAGVLLVLRRLGLAFVEVRNEERADHDPGRDRPAST
jgi:hypothetical protein